MILGGATSKIGDPSDKLKERPRLEEKEINDYYREIEKQINNLLFKQKEVDELDYKPLETFYNNQELLTNVHQALKIEKNNS